MPRARVPRIDSVESPNAGFVENVVANAPAESTAHAVAMTPSRCHHEVGEPGPPPGAPVAGARFESSCGFVVVADRGAAFVLVALVAPATPRSPAIAVHGRTRREPPKSGSVVLRF